MIIFMMLEFVLELLVEKFLELVVEDSFFSLLNLKSKKRLEKS